MPYPLDAYRHRRTIAPATQPLLPHPAQQSQVAQRNRSQPSYPGSARGLREFVFLVLRGDPERVQEKAERLMTTSAAARVLGCSRQHVVDLCDQGELPFVKVGSHRRLLRADVEAVLRPPLTRDQERSLWLHRAVAGRLATYPAPTLATAHRNLETMDRAHPRGIVRVLLGQWECLLSGSLDELFDVLVSPTARAVELRQNSPFAGVLPEPARLRVLASFRDHWRREHAA